MSEPTTLDRNAVDLTAQVSACLDLPALKRICEMSEYDFASAYGLATFEVPQERAYVEADRYWFKDNGSDILAVAHLDTVVDHAKRTATFYSTTDGVLVNSGALDDRLGAYIILELLPRFGITHDVLLTIGEESGCSTAEHFVPPEDKGYNWMIEFDRGGTDVVMYQYEDDDTIEKVQDCGAIVGDGIFSDISYMDSLGIKGFNWGVGYRDYHSTNGHAYLEETAMMVGHYLTFHETNSGLLMPHVPDPWAGMGRRGGGSRWSQWWDRLETECRFCGAFDVDIDTAWCESCGQCNECSMDVYDEDCICDWRIAELEYREAMLRYADVEDVPVRDGIL